MQYVNRGQLGWWQQGDHLEGILEVRAFPAHLHHIHPCCFHQFHFSCDIQLAVQNLTCNHINSHWNLITEARKINSTSNQEQMFLEFMHALSVVKICPLGSLTSWPTLASLVVDISNQSILFRQGHSTRLPVKRLLSVPATCLVGETRSTYITKFFGYEIVTSTSPCTR